MRLMILGAGGQLGTATARAASMAGHDVHALTHAELDIGDRDAVEQAVAGFAPAVIINAAAFTTVDGCEREPERAYAANTVAVRHLAVAATRNAAHVVHVSTDYVFDGRSEVPYREWDPTAPVNVYGRSKLGGELELSEHSTSWTVARTSWVFGAPASDLPHWAIREFRAGTLAGVLADATSVPTYAPDLAATLLQFAAARAPGIFHVVNEGSATRHDLCVAALEAAGLDGSAVPRLSAEALNRAARRPDYTVLDATTMQQEGFAPLRHWRDALRAYIEGAT